MLLDVAAGPQAVSAVVVVERKEVGKEHSVQRPVYYVSEVLSEAKQRYPHWQNLVFGVFMASRKLKPYFQEHPITVVSSIPLAGIIRNSEATGRVAMWAIEMGRIISTTSLVQPSSIRHWLIFLMIGHS